VSGVRCQRLGPGDRGKRRAKAELEIVSPLGVDSGSGCPLGRVEFLKVEGETRNRVNDERLVFLEILEGTVGIDQFHQASLEVEPRREQGTGDRE
jgi:hypothetical protein